MAKTLSSKPATQEDGQQAGETAIAATVPDAILDGVSEITSPAIIYDLAAVTQTIQQLQQDLQTVAHTALYFSVKANRNPEVLRFLADLSLGADVASMVELNAATTAGFKAICATSPGFSAGDVQQLTTAGARVDFSSVSQLRQWCSKRAAGASRQTIGLRLQYWVSEPEQPTSRPRPKSRFGIDPTDPALTALIKRYNLQVTRLHVHAGEPRSAQSVCELFGFLVNALDYFPAVESFNLGGGWTYLFYVRRSQLRQALRAIGKTLDGINRNRAVPIQLILEPGMLLLLMAGYLVTEVKAVDQPYPNRLTAVVNASAWNLMSWTPRWIVGQIPQRLGAEAHHDIAGCTCFEEDYFVQRHSMSPVEVGDRIIFNAAGAYVSSMARSLHGLPTPPEWILKQGQLHRAARSEADL